MMRSDRSGQADVVVAPYDPSWPDAFETAKAELVGVVGDEAVVEHIGSTSVPGLAAKPIIDVMVGLPDLRRIEAKLFDLECLGYRYVPEYEEELPDRRYFRRPDRHPHTHHLHCVVEGSPFWLSHLAFRDHLRAHPEDAAEYARLKLDLAQRHRSDRKAYLAGKSDFIGRVLRHGATG